MAINPVGPQGTAHTGAHHSHHAGHAHESQEVTPTAAAETNPLDPATSDLLQLSDVAQTSIDGSVPTGTLSADALRSITQKLASGAYDSQAVADRIAGKLIDGGQV